MIDWATDELERAHAEIDGKTACGQDLTLRVDSDEPILCEECIDILFGLLETAPGFDA